MPPIFFAEISCVTSPVLGTPFIGDLPRVTRVGEPINGKYSLTGEEPAELSPYLRIRELELIDGYRKYNIKVGGGRHFIAFRQLSILDPLEFYNSAKNEISRINRVLNCIYPVAAKISLSDTICIYVDDTTIRPYWKDSKVLHTSVEIQVVEEQSVVDSWTSFLKSVLENRSEMVFRLFDLEESDPVTAACVALISQNTFPAFYSAYEIITNEYGRKHDFIRTGPFSRREISDFTDNAQVARHANRSIGPNTKLMGVPEAKLFVMKMLNFYIKDRYGNGNPAVQT